MPISGGGGGPSGAAFRIQGSVNAAQGFALDGVSVYVCSQPVSNASTIPPSPLATIYTDSTALTVLPNPVSSDGLGNWYFYAPAGLYTLVVYDPLNRIPMTVFPDQGGNGGGGGGGVSDVALTMPAEFSVTGSPITSSGTLVVTKANEPPNTVFAGPTSGSPGQPTFRALVAADIPGLGVGVTSVGLAVNASSLFTASVSGPNPITTTGTFTLNISFANQGANTVLAGPSSGSPAPPTFRTLTPTDLPSLLSFTPIPETTSFTASTFSAMYRVTTAAGTIVATLPTAVGNAGQVFIFKKVDSGAGTVVITPTGGQTIDGLSTFTLNVQYQYIALMSNGATFDIWSRN
jgi:hypothetical protein